MLTHMPVRQQIGQQDQQPEPDQPERSHGQTARGRQWGHRRYRRHRHIARSRGWRAPSVGLRIGSMSPGRRLLCGRGGGGIDRRHRGRARKGRWWNIAHPACSLPRGRVACRRSRCWRWYGRPRRASIRHWTPRPAESHALADIIQPEWIRQRQTVAPRGRRVVRLKGHVEDPAHHKQSKDVVHVIG